MDFKRDAMISAFSRIGIGIALVFAFTFSTEAQIGSYKNPLADDPIDVNVRPQPPLSERLARRKTNYYFFHTIRKISEPSTISLPFSSATKNLTGTQKKPFTLDANIQTPIPIGGKGFGMFTIHVIPQFKVRIFRNDSTVGDRSGPVRTPSTMPGVNIYWAPRNWWNNSLEKNDLRKFAFFGLRIYHHSNGQDNPETDTIRGPVNIYKINTYNGNFAEQVVFEPIIGGKFGTASEALYDRNINYKEFLMDSADMSAKKLERIKTKMSTNGRRAVMVTSRNYEFYWKISYEYHAKKASDSLFYRLGIYGRNRLNISTGALVLPKRWEFIGDGKLWYDITQAENYERWRFTFDVSYILDKRYNYGELNNLSHVSLFDAGKRINLCGTAYWVIGSSKNAALFAQVGYYASDNYNIYFHQTIWNFQIGLALGFFDQPETPDKY